jgi:SAM-dependent methyltransferase
VIRLLRALRASLARATRSRGERRHSAVGSARLWKMKREFQLAFLKGRGLQPSDYLLDIGCGTLRGGLPIIGYLEAGHYFGVEVRADVLEEARKELREAGLENKDPVLVTRQAMADLDIDRVFDYVWAFSVLIHMSDDVLAETLGLVAGALADDGVFYANVNIGFHDIGTWREFPLVARPLAFYQEACAREGLAVSDLGPLRSLGHVSGRDDHDSQRMLRITREP